MAAPDILAISDALATSYSSLTPPTGYPAIRRATTRRPNAIPTFPFVSVDLPDGELQVGPTVFTLNYRVRFWLAKHTGDQARDDAVLLSWLGVLIMAALTSTTLGQAQVKSALASTFRYFVDDYASTTDCFGWEFDQPVIIRDWPLS